MRSGSRRSPASIASFKKKQLCLVIAALLAPALSLAAPVIGNGGVTSGSATIVQTGAVTNINQSTTKASINWQSFSTKPTETVNFNQPGASSITLNRVIGNEKSVLEGALNATGQVFLVNSNGVLFAKGSTVNTGGFVASTLNLTDADFNAGNYVFKASGGTGSVINMGTLTARDGGYVALLGNTVSNQGVISATKGTVAMNAGDRITLNFNGDSLLSVTLDEGTLNALVENKQAIYADGGRVILTAKAADELLAAQVNNTGVIQARTIDDLKGSIELYAHGGTTHVDGTLDSSAPTAGDGGAIETSGDHVKIADSAVVTTKATYGKTGSWLIDPTDFTIAASGGDITGTLLSKLLGKNNITFSTSDGTSGTSGNLYVNDAISWDAATSLSLTAANNLYVNSAISGQYSAYSSATPTVKAGLALTAGNDIDVNNAITLSNAALTMTYGNAYNIRTKASYSGTTTNANGKLVAQTDTSGGVYGSITFKGGFGSGDALSINGNAYTLIYSMSQLDHIDGMDAVTGKYYNTVTKAYDIPASKVVTTTEWGNSYDTTYYYDPATGQYDLTSVYLTPGFYALAQTLDASGTTYTAPVVAALSGTLAGLGHSVSNLTINDASSDYVGLIGQATTGSVLRDIGVVNASVTTQRIVSPSDTGAWVGALVGYDSGTVTHTYSTGSVTGQGGGLIGYAEYAVISDSYSDASVSPGIGWGGGLIGYASASSVQRSHATGKVSGHGGGLIGEALYGIAIANSYATGAVGADLLANGTGGLVGYVMTSTDYDSSIVNSFALGNVIGESHLGGLVGKIDGSADMTIDNAYATGNVTASASTAYYGAGVGGLIGTVGLSGDAKLTISNSHASGNVTVLGTGVQYAGGLIGVVGRTGTIIANSYAEGNVTAPHTAYVGGLIGSATNTTVTHSHATGNVVGAMDVSGSGGVGGLAGFFDEGTIDDSYASGTVTGNATNQGARTVGGLVGDAPFTTVSNSYWNADSNSDGGYQVVPSDGSKGLTRDQFSDISNYLDGSIGQVLADRATAAEAATRQAARQAQEAADARQAHVADAGQHADGLVQQALQQGVVVLPSLAALANPVPAIDGHIVFADSRSFSADIKSITVDGVRFDLDDTEPVPPAPDRDERRTR
jgi:filamentous hemagglutinin family protein